MAQAGACALGIPIILVGLVSGLVGCVGGIRGRDGRTVLIGGLGLAINAAIAALWGFVLMGLPARSARPQAPTPPPATSPPPWGQPMPQRPYAHPTPPQPWDGRGAIAPQPQPAPPPGSRSPLSMMPDFAAQARGRTELQGEWVAESLQKDGTPVQVEPNTIRYMFVGNTIIHRGPAVGSGHILYQVDAAKEPHEIDLQFIGGMAGPSVAQGIYRVEDGTLTLCYGGPNASRPTDFTGRPGQGRTLVVLKRGDRSAGLRAND